MASLTGDVLIRLMACLLMMAMPIGLGTFLGQELSCHWKVFIKGAVCFMASQFVHVVLLVTLVKPIVEAFGADLETFETDQELSTSMLVLVAVSLGLSAALAEEGFRWMCYSKYMSGPGELAYKQAVMLGAGHGGCESFVTGAVGILTLANMLSLKYTDPNQLPSGEKDALLQTMNDYFKDHGFVILLGPLERLFAMVFHLSASVLVWRGFTTQNRCWLMAAILFHTALDAVAIFVMKTWNAYVVECILCFGVVPFSLWILYYFNNKQSDDNVDFVAVPQSDTEDLIMDDDAEEDSSQIEMDQI